PVWSRPEVTGASRVRTPPELRDVLAEGAAPPPTVAILGGGKPGLTLALALRTRGASTTVTDAPRVRRARASVSPGLPPPRIATVGGGAAPSASTSRSSGGVRTRLAPVTSGRDHTGPVATTTASTCASRTSATVTSAPVT